MQDESNIIAETGVIHGRFQILHNDHVRYILEGKKHCRHLVVGITNPDPISTKREAADVKRDDPLENPLTYFERYLLIKAMLAGEGMAMDDFSITPFPISFPDRYRYYVPMDALFFLTIYDDWGRKKLSYFRSLGLKTHILREVDESEKGISATTIRQLMVNDAPWEHLVPGSVAHCLKLWQIPSRLKGIANRLSREG